MTHEEIVDKVKSILNEHGEVDALSIGDDRVQLENYINVAIPDAVVMLASKGYWVNVVRGKDEDEIPFVNTTGGFAPEDFVSLVSFVMPLWKKIVTKVTERESPEFAIAQNEYTRPGVNTPMVYMGPVGELYGLPQPSKEYLEKEPEADKAIVFYNAKYNPYKADAETGEMVVDENYELKAAPKEATAVCYMAAALVLGMFGDDQGKQRLSDISTNLLN